MIRRLPLRLRGGEAPAQLDSIAWSNHVRLQFTVKHEAPQEQSAMSPKALQSYLHAHIPLSKAMEVSVLEVRPLSVTLSAPLAPNINHRDTVFGGSASAVAILAAWSLLHIRLGSEGVTSRLVIQRNTMSYALPIDGTFTAIAAAPSSEDWAQFLRAFKRRGKARITVSSELHFAGQVAGRLEGEFAALGATSA